MNTLGFKIELKFFLWTLLFFVAAWLLQGCAVHMVPAGSASIGGGVAMGVTQFTNNNQSNQPFNGCPRVCNAMGVCTSNPALYPQMARSGATCVGNNNNPVIVNGQAPNGNQIYNCKSGGTGTADQCRARDAGAGSNTNVNQVQSKIYNCKSGGTGTAAFCSQQDAQKSSVACKSGGTQPTIELCQQKDFRAIKCAKEGKVLCPVSNETDWYIDEKNVLSIKT